MTDDLDMGAVSALPDATKQAILAGNDLLSQLTMKKALRRLKMRFKTRKFQKVKLKN